MALFGLASPFGAAAIYRTADALVPVRKLLREAGEALADKGRVS